MDEKQYAAALEAALLVLSGDTPLVAAGQGAMSVLAEPAWVDQLAAEYEERAALREELAREARAADRHQNAADLAMWASHYRNLSAELRERARGGER